MVQDKKYRDYPSVIFLVAAVMLAAIVNVAAWRSSEPVLTDSTEYIHGGISLFSGHGYESIYGGPQTLYPPGLSIAVGLANVVVREPVLAARLVIILASILSIIPLTLIASRLFGKSAGIATGLAFALLPARTVWSSVVTSETPYLFLVLVGVYLWLKECDSHRWVRAAAMGAVLGYAYLVRPEGLLCGLAVLAFTFLPRKFGTMPSRRSALIAGLAFVVVACPYVIYLRCVVGKWTISNKPAGLGSGIFVLESKGIPWETVWRLNKAGTDFDWDRWTETRSEFATRVAKNVVVEARDVGRQIGRLLKLVLFLGLMLELYRSNSVLSRSITVLFILGIPLLLFPMLYPEPRFVYMGVPPVLMLACWQLVTRFRAPWADNPRSRFAALTLWLPLFLVCAHLTYGLRSIVRTNVTPTECYVAGQWVADTVPEGESIMTSAPATAFYANRRTVRLPYDEMHKVLRYASLKKNHYILMLPSDTKWFEQNGELQKGISKGLLEPVGELRSRGKSAAWLYRVE